MSSEVDSCQTLQPGREERGEAVKGSQEEVRAKLEEVSGKLEAAMECGHWSSTLLLFLILLGGNSGEYQQI